MGWRDHEDPVLDKCEHGEIAADCPDCELQHVEDREARHDELDRVKESGELSFGAALAYLKQGKRVARRGWNGKGMWLVLVNPLAGANQEGPAYFVKSPLWEGESGIRPLPWIGMKTADNCFVPWLASQTDILAEDWEIVG